MTHIFHQVVHPHLVRQVLTDLLLESIREMRTVNLENEDDSDWGNILNPEKLKRKSRYTLEEISQWSELDWELEIQLAPEFEEVREAIHEFQEKTRHIPQDFISKEVKPVVEELGQKVLEILKRKTLNRRTFLFSTNSLPISREGPKLEVIAESIGFSPTQELLLLNLGGIFNKKAALELMKVVETILSPSEPYCVLDFSKTDWLERSALKVVEKFGSRLRQQGGDVALVCVQPDERQKIREELPQWQNQLFLDRGGAVEYFALTFSGSG